TFHISYTIPAIANFSAERAFSKLACKKNKYRKNSFQEYSNNFMVMCTESDVLEIINSQDVIKEFASQKSRNNYLSIQTTFLFLYFKKVRNKFINIIFFV
ncbi:zinc finger MYM-type protein 1-like, partial [Aphis craccivora]